jgi:REP element-mobilizing transposase RayT
MSASFKSFNEDPDKTFIFYINLPHWRQEGVTYFVTWRLGDSLPQSMLRQHAAERDAWIKAHGLRDRDDIKLLPEEKRHEYHARFTAELHRWLDAGHGSCVLRKTECSRIVGDALRYFDGKRYALDGFVVMPNHVHLLVAPHEDWSLSKIFHTWKSFTSHEINKLLGRCGPLWQQESWNHIVRSEDQFDHFRRYITENPEKGKLLASQYLLGRGTGIATRRDEKEK